MLLSIGRIVKALMAGRCAKFYGRMIWSMDGHGVSIDFTSWQLGHRPWAVEEKGGPVGGRDCWRAYGCVWKYLKELRPMRWLALCAIVLGAISGFSGGFAIPVLLKHIVHRIFNCDGGASLVVLTLYCALPVAVIGLRSMCGFFATCIMAKLGQEIVRSIREKVFRKLQHLPFNFFRRTQSGQLISMAFNDSNVIQSCMVSIAHEIVQRPVTFVSAIGAVIYLCLQQSGGRTLLLLIVLVAASGIPIVSLGKKVWRRNLEAQGKIANLTAHMLSNLQSVQEVRAFCRERHEMLKFRQANRSYSRTYLSACRAYYMIVPSVEIWAAAGIGMALFYGYCIHIPGGTFLAIAMALFLAYDHIKHIGRLYGNLQSCVAALYRIEGLLAEPEANAVDEFYQVALGKLCGEISFRDVSFSYEPDLPLFQNFSLDLTSGKSYALVGPNGAGKTTVANLILRFYEAQSGSIFFGGKDIGTIPLEQLRSSIALVSQQPALLHDTVAANIRWGNLLATDAMVLDAARRSRAIEFIERLPNGMDTVIGEDGNVLSGGQRQRIALARAFLKDASVLILDEATNSLDVRSEKEIIDVLPELFRGRTALVISHRFQWLPHVDEIIVLDGGKIVQRGTHGELLASDGLYRNLYAMRGDC
jgi:subfamily B ATP-binding cassette protein MsbA